MLWIHLHKIVMLWTHLQKTVMLCILYCKRVWYNNIVLKIDCEYVLHKNVYVKVYKDYYVISVNTWPWMWKRWNIILEN